MDRDEKKKTIATNVYLYLNFIFLDKQNVPHLKQDKYLFECEWRQQKEPERETRKRWLKGLPYLDLKEKFISIMFVFLCRCFSHWNLARTTNVC